MIFFLRLRAPSASLRPLTANSVADGGRLHPSFYTTLKSTPHNKGAYFPKTLQRREKPQKGLYFQKTLRTDYYAPVSVRGGGALKLTLPPMV